MFLCYSLPYSDPVIVSHVPVLHESRLPYSDPVIVSHVPLLQVADYLVVIL